MPYSLPQPINPVNGGTGDATLTAHNVLIGEGTSAVAFAAPGATSGVALISKGAAADPAFGTVVPAGGGTGLTSLTAHNVLVGEGTSNVALVDPTGAASGVPLVSQGAAADPTFGIATVAGGGTGLGTLTAHNVILGEGTSNVAFAAPGATTGVPLVSNGAASDPSFGTASIGGGGTGATSLAGHGAVVMNAAGTAMTVVAPGSNGNVLTSNGTDWTSAASSSLSAVTDGGIYGDGSDGNVTIAANTTLTRQMYYNNLTINTGKTLSTAGFRVQVMGTLTFGSGTAIIDNSGNNASGTTAGAALSGGFYGQASTMGSAGGNGGASGGANAGSPGTNISGCLGGAGGAGGASGGTAGPAGTATPPTANQGGIPHDATLVDIPEVLTGITYTSASGGGGGGGAASGAGGGGGGGGGIVVVCAKAISGAGVIQANGGNGANGTAANGAGGGGGGGGYVLVVSRTNPVPCTVQALGGTKGTHQGTGGDGNNGNAGTVVQLLGV